MRELVEIAVERAGGVEYLITLATEEPRTFASLFKEMIPKEQRIEQNVTQRIIHVLPIPSYLPSVTAFDPEGTTTYEVDGKTAQEYAVILTAFPLSVREYLVDALRTELVQRLPLTSDEVDRKDSPRSSK
jgi:hypothetical protein